ncbi:hypothetical protein Hypma_014235 [Hypsizygus marmoreus]|uniref:Uncharacterized protein n=1 Tax=Hypsizygus marmoreus TaxID=39966 RepID=A0A369JEV1_HYPMA|nr:hypothetical protein Hypma_014235 [Hypsizygus marmoreus]
MEHRDDLGCTSSSHTVASMPTSHDAISYLHPLLQSTHIVVLAEMEPQAPICTPSHQKTRYMGSPCVTCCGSAGADAWRLDPPRPRTSSATHASIVAPQRIQPGVLMQTSGVGTHV